MDSVSFFWPNFIGQVVFVLDKDDEARKEVTKKLNQVTNLKKIYSFILKRNI